jgi:ubiquinone/menaquinone biosynthesis C-methylase UbiE
MDLFTWVPRGARLGSQPPSVAPERVDAYWEEFTVLAKPFAGTTESLEYLDWRAAQYPLFAELMELYGTHDDEVILDYGCGPGNDVVGFVAHTYARKVIGIDVSAKALELARRRLALHDAEGSRFELIKSTDAATTIPLADASVDFVNSGGVLHHTSHPQELLCELYRVLRPGGRAIIMVYNRDSLWYHLHAAYIKQVVEGAWTDMSADDAFQRTTDSEECPLARAYHPEAWSAMCRRAAFDPVEFVGGYLSLHELEIWTTYGKQAMADRRLGREHRKFLRALTVDAGGLPLYRGKHAGIGGVYKLRKA